MCSARSSAGCGKRETATERGWWCINPADAEALAASDRVLSVGDAGKLYEDDGSPLDKYRNTIRQIARRTATFGETFDLGSDRWLVPTMDTDEAWEIVRALGEQGYLSTEVGSENYVSFALTPAGLEYANQLQHEAHLQSTSVFVAACFSTELEEARDTIKRVVEELGYKPRIVNLEPHNDLIDTKIFELIQQSRFVVADLTCNRQSVYYEAGYAHGMGLQVVLTCRSDHFNDREDDQKRVHFDLSHRPVLTWETCEELAEKLRDHIYQSFGSMSGGKPDMT